MIINSQIAGGGGGGTAHSIRLRNGSQTGALLTNTANVGIYDPSNSTWTGWSTPTAACVGDTVHVKNSAYTLLASKSNVTWTDTGYRYGNTIVYGFEMPDYDVEIVVER